MTIIDEVRAMYLASLNDGPEHVVTSQQVFDMLLARTNPYQAVARRAVAEWWRSR